MAIVFIFFLKKKINNLYEEGKNIIPLLIYFIVIKKNYNLTKKIKKRKIE